MPENDILELVAKKLMHEKESLVAYAIRAGMDPRRVVLCYATYPDKVKIWIEERDAN